MAYDAFKTGYGDVCTTKFKKMDKGVLRGAESDIIRMLDIHIEGTDKKHGNKCTLTAIIWTYSPENKLASINHKSEKVIIEELDNLLLKK